MTFELLQFTYSTITFLLLVSKTHWPDKVEQHIKYFFFFKMQLLANIHVETEFN